MNDFDPPRPWTTFFVDVALQKMQSCRRDSVAVRALFLAAPLLVFAKASISTASAQGLTVTPQIGVTETASSNPGLASPAAAKQGWVTDIAPSLRIDGRGARGDAFLDYRWHDLVYSNQRRLNSRQSFLDSRATVVPVDEWLFVEARASVTRQNTSAFASAQTENAAGGSANQAETSAYRLAPYVRGVLAAGSLAYRLRFDRIQARSQDDTLPLTRVAAWQGQLTNQAAASKVGWSIDVDALTADNRVIDRRTDRRLKASMNFETLPDVRVSLLAGRERTNFLTHVDASYATPGLGLTWTPTDRTQIAVVEEDRFFGRGHAVALTHRTQRSVWRYADKQDVIVLPQALADGRVGAIAKMIDDMLVASIRDPLARSEAARKQLRDSALPAESIASGGFLTACPSLQRDREASFAYFGTKNTMTVSLSKSVSRVIGDSFGVADSFSLSETIQQAGYSGQWAHRLSPLATWVMGFTELRSTGLSVASLQSKERRFDLLATMRLGPRVTTALGLRRVLFSGVDASTSYQESALSGSIAVSF